MTNGIIYKYVFPSPSIYVGQTWNLHKRHQTHLSACNRQKHRNRKFQGLVQRYGLPEPIILYQGITTQAELNRLEQLCIDRYGAAIENGGVNMQMGGSHGKHTQASIEKMVRSGAAHGCYNAEVRKYSKTIYQMWENGNTLRSIAETFSVSDALIRKIISEQWEGTEKELSDRIESQLRQHRSRAMRSEWANTGAIAQPWTKERRCQHSRIMSKQIKTYSRYRQDLRDRWREICGAYAQGMAVYRIGHKYKAAPTTIKSVLDEYFEGYLAENAEQLTFF